VRADLPRRDRSVLLGPIVTVARTDSIGTTSTEVLREHLASRHSCRAFRPDPVPRDVLETIFDLARRTPSWCNTQPWQAYVTEGEGTERFRLALLAQVAADAMSPDFDFPVRYEGEFRERRRACAWQLYDALGIEFRDRAASVRQTARNFELFGAPHVAIITTESALGTYGAVDTGPYVQTFLLAAESLGLGAIPQAALAGHAPFIKEHFGMPESRAVVCGISFGWPDKPAPENGFRTERTSVAETLMWSS